MNTSPTGIVAPMPQRTRMRTDATPWHRQFWPWFLIALPAISVVFSFATLYIAVSGADEVVPHEGDSASYAAPHEPGHGVAAAEPAVGGAIASHARFGAGPADATRDDSAARGEPDHGAP